MAQSKMPSGAHALVFGTSGLAGWGVVDQLLDNYPTQGTFSKVTAMINRPSSVAESYWPSPSPSRPELELVSCVNLAVADETIETFTASLKEKVKGMTSVTHVFYFGTFEKQLNCCFTISIQLLTKVSCASAYKQDDVADAEVKTNRETFERAIGALNSLSPDLTFVVSPGGAKVNSPTPASLKIRVS